ncbi:MAG: TlpA disulfide reductase family protein [Pseudomonadota bacterium]|nr:TlpA disulfide reductase family protein [Pseudomonadota bacterium]
MFYTRLSTNFQPKTAQPPRRWFLSAGFAVWASCFAGGMTYPLASVRAKTLSISTGQNIKTVPLMTQPVTDANGEAFTLKSLRGRPLLINFWATWCAPCIAEMSSLQKAAEQLHPDGIDVVLISVDRGGVNKALPVLRANGVITPRLGFDPKATLSREMGVTGLPTSFLLSADQLRCAVYVGPHEWHEDHMQAEIHRFVAVTTGLSEAASSLSKQS